MPLLGFGTWRLRGSASQCRRAAVAMPAPRARPPCTATRLKWATHLRTVDLGPQRGIHHDQASPGQGGPGHQDAVRQPARPGHQVRQPVAGALAAARPGPRAGVAGVPRPAGRGPGPGGRGRRLLARADRPADPGHREAPAVNQIPWSPARYDAAVLGGERRAGVALEGYSPLKGTDLAEPVLAGIAKDHGVTPAQVVLRWHLEHGITVIPKSERPERIATNFDVMQFLAGPRRR